MHQESEGAGQMIAATAPRNQQDLSHGHQELMSASQNFQGQQGRPRRHGALVRVLLLLAITSPSPAAAAVGLSTTRREMHGV